MSIPEDLMTSSPESPGAPTDDATKDSYTFLDASGNTTIPVMMDMVEQLSTADDPHQVLKAFREGFRRLSGPQGYVSLSTRGLEAGEYKITRLLTEDTDPIEAADPWKNWSTLALHRGGLFGEIIATPTPKIINDLNVHHDPVVGDAIGKFGSLMAIPLFDRGEALNWSITLREQPGAFTVEEMADTILRANLGGATVKNVMITKQLRDANRQIERELEQVARIQRALLPAEMPDIPGVELGASYETFDQVGGDLYLIRPLRKDADGTPDPQGPWAIMIADASGHGPAAAVVIAMLYSIIEAYPKTPSGPAEVLMHANLHLFNKRIESSFVTAVFGVYDPVSRKFTYSRAGHNPPVHMIPADEGWNMQRLDAVGGVPLGVLDHVEYEEATVQLEPGQALVFYTDGITEARSPNGRYFEVVGIERSLRNCSGYPSCVIGHVTEELKGHEDGERPNDDQTLLVMRVL